VTVDLLKDLLKAFNEHDLDRVMGFLADDCVTELPRDPEPHGLRLVGKERVREGRAGRFRGLPDVHYGDDRRWVSGDHGVSTRLLNGTTADGCHVRGRGCDLLALRDGRIVRKDSYWKIVEPEQP